MGAGVRRRRDRVRPPGRGLVSPPPSLTRLARLQVQVDRRGALLVADDHDHGALGHPDRQRVGLVDEVLITAHPAVHVAGQHVDRLVLLAHGARDRDVGLGERDADRDAEADRQVEEAEDEAKGDDDDEARAAAPKPSAPVVGPRSSAPALFPHGRERKACVTDRRRDASRPLMGKVLVALAAVLAIATGCVRPGSCSGCTAAIDWVDFVKVGTTMYVAGPQPNVNVQETDLGPVYSHVKFKVDGNVCDPSYRPKDGDAAFLDPGTAIYEVK